MYHSYAYNCPVCAFAFNWYSFEKVNFAKCLMILSRWLINDLIEDEQIDAKYSTSTILYISAMAAGSKNMGKEKKPNGLHPPH